MIVSFPQVLSLCFVRARVGAKKKLFRGSRRGIILVKMKVEL